MSLPRTGATWLKPFFDCLDGKGNRPIQLGSPTGYFGLYGMSGVQRLTGAGSTLGTTGLSGAASVRSNGGTGTNFVSFSDLVLHLKLRGDIAT